MLSRRFALVALLIPAYRVRAQSHFVRIPLGKGASIELPKNWEIMSAGSRVTLDAAVEALGMKLTNSDLNFAANLYDDNGKTLALANARFYPENTLTQAQTKELGPEDVDAIGQQLRKVTEPPLQARGAKVTRWYPPMVRQINGLYVFVHEHQQVGPGDVGPTRVRGLRVWASPRSFTVTFSYREARAQLLQPIIERATNSLRLD